MKIWLLAIKLNHETKITFECVLFITRKQKQATFPQVQKLFVPCTSFKRSLTRFPSCLSKQTFCKLLGLFGTDMKCIVFHRNLLKPEDQFCSLTLLSQNSILLSPALSQTSWKHTSITQACWRCQNKNPTWGRNPSYHNFLYAFI